MTDPPHEQLAVAREMERLAEQRARRVRRRRERLEAQVKRERRLRRRVPRADTPSARLRAARLERGWSVRELADRLGVTQERVRQVEHGTQRLLEPTIERYAAALEVRAAWVVTGRGRARPRSPESMQCNHQ